MRVQLPPVVARNSRRSDYARSEGETTGQESVNADQKSRGGSEGRGKEDYLGLEADSLQGGRLSGRKMTGRQPSSLGEGALAPLMLRNRNRCESIRGLAQV
jgi:hypothetical protein